jgi:phage gp46-like protein
MARGYFYLFVLMVTTAVACNDFIEEDLENDQIVLLGPADNVSTESQTLTFWWDDLEGASGYRLQIVNPDFENLTRLELDTLVAGNKFEHTLYAGDFEWRVRAENSTSVSEFVSRKLTILEPVDITKQKVVLVSPGKEAMINQNQVTFQWNELSIAHEYQLELHQPDWSGEEVLEPKKLSETKLALELKEGKYSWGVLARDTVKKEETPYTYRNLIVDLTAPKSPVLTTPADKGTLAGLKQTLVWSHQEEKKLTEVKFLLQVYSNRELTLLVKEKELTEKQTEITFTKEGTYYWLVKAIDGAGNESENSQVFSFTLNDE